MFHGFFRGGVFILWKVVDRENHPHHKVEDRFVELTPVIAGSHFCEKSAHGSEK